MTVKLITDFEDYYDAYFSKDGDIEFQRLSEKEPTRKQVFELLRKYGLVTPAFGQVKKFLRKCKREQAVVVYENITTHSGGKKSVMSFREALHNHSQKHMSLYSASDKGVSYRYLRIGQLAYLLKYQSDEWSSIVNTKSIEIEEADPGFLTTEPDYPLYAIDFVHFKDAKQDDVMVAIDFNIAPKLKNTGIEKWIDGVSVVNQIENWLNQSRK
ncbi:hypothetical protein ACFVS2_21240 [Brevibacillus sp. NPDC058079]|uniref:hypothetical protein n=1 Tax=Brevibacillus sp. NPDC058079 TaxID=3346330 RepID=UPI0036E51AE6